MKERDFVVMKFGGTSVATLAGWQTIAARIALCLEQGLTPVVVHSALAGVSNLLEATLEACTRDAHRPLLDKIRQQHLELARTFEVDGDALLADDFALLTKLTSGIALIGEVSPRQRARITALGELMASRIGYAYLRKHAINVATLDARDLLTSRDDGDSDDSSQFLSAECPFDPDPALRDKLNANADAYLTQGFIARNTKGETVLLGRGGSDTSASYLAAKLRARRIEIWTDVAGMYSADPRLVPGARLLKRLDYREAQEIATTGAKVLHPRCLEPPRVHNIPLHVLSTAEPDAAGTLVSSEPGSTAPRLKAISARKGVTLVSMESSGMWRQAGFLGKAFALFGRRQISVDLISTSETSVTVSLDAPPARLADGTLARLVAELSEFCTVKVIDRCAAISLVGRQVRAILHEVAPAFEVFKEYEIYLLSQAANNLNFTFVVDDKHSDRLVQRLHDLLIKTAEQDPVMGPSWAESQAGQRPQDVVTPVWWERSHEQLVALAPANEPLFVYDAQTLRESATSLRGIASVSRVLYSIKANSNPALLMLLAEQGIDFECVSRYEIEHIRQVLPDVDTSRLLFTPNFAPRSEYEFAKKHAVRTTIDNHFVLEHWPELFTGQELMLRVDPGQGQGHHRYVQTAGKNSKFGVPLREVNNAFELAERAGAHIVGLHAHKGSGIVEPTAWAKTARTLARAADGHDDIGVLNLGGGLGVPDSRHAKRLDLSELERTLACVRADNPDYDLWLEPGRFVVAGAGVILTRVTQCKVKDGVNYVGLNAGMNSLLRPALYGAYHEIVNLTRLHETPDQLVDIVGPICESADVLGSARMLPPTREGDVILIANCGAYGRVMSSQYNLRPPGDERLI